MKHLVLVILTWSLAVGCNSNSESPTMKEASPEELSQMNKDFARYINEKNATAAANLYDEHAMLLPPNEKTVSGRAQIQKYWQGAIDGGVGNVSVSTVDARSNGDLGYEVGRYHLTIKNANGTTTSETGKYIELLKRDGSGKWLSTYGIWNADTIAVQEPYSPY